MNFDLWAIDDSDLDVYQFRMFCHIARVGICYQSVHTLGELCHMSSGKASTTRKWLEDNGYIKLAKDDKSGRFGYRIVQFWRSPDEHESSRDEQTQQNSSPDEQNVHHMNGNVHHMNGNVHHMNLRNTTIRQQHKEEKEYIYTGTATDDQIIPLIEALKTVTKERYTNGSHSKYDDLALSIYHDGATPKTIHGFASWWNDNCYYVPPSKAALKTIGDHWLDYMGGKSLNKPSPNGHGPHNETPAQRIARLFPDEVNNEMA